MDSAVSRLHNHFHNMYSELGIRVIKSRKMGWSGHVAHTVKVKLSLCLTKYHAIKAYWGVKV